MCNTLVKARKLRRHLSVKCPKNKQLRIKLILSSSAGHSSTATISREIPESVGTRDVKREKVYDQVSGRDRIDATKDYAHNFREDGRFGSHPSHDGFDDDSGPE
jgi:phage FluMu protein Com